MSQLSAFTQLAILLTGRWAIGPHKTLTNAELLEIRRAIGGTEEGATALIDGMFSLDQLPLDTERVSGLLKRGLGVFQNVDKWTSAGIWVVSWTDAEYPEQFKQLKQRAPALVFGLGNPNGMQQKALAVFGSRNASDTRLEQAEAIGSACAEHNITLVSGGARGVDAQAMAAAARADGLVIGVLADSLLRESAKKIYRDALANERLCLMSEVHPEAGFDVGSAMSRNRLAYACADATLIVECDPDKGGTWSGAVEALKAGKTVYVLEATRAEKQLVERGAIRVDIDAALQPDYLVNSDRPISMVPAQTNRNATPLSAELRLFDLD